MPSVLLPTVQAPAVVAVTGANGFIAQHCIQQLLLDGYHVVGTVRSEAKAKAVIRSHSENPRLRVVVVADMTCTRELVDALKPLAPTAICHLAAPFTSQVSDLERDIMIPAVRGSLAILEAAVEIGNIKKVAYMSSFAAMLDPTAEPNPNKIYTPDDWNPMSYEDGVNAKDWLGGYFAGKTWGEKVAWEFLKRRDATFDLVSLCPVMVHGPFIPGALPQSSQDINTSNALIWAISKLGRDAAIPVNGAPVWVDVRDVAACCVKALTVPEAAGRRFLLCASSYDNQEVADLAREISPKTRSIPLGQPGRRTPCTLFGTDASETERVLGIKWTSLRESLTDLVPQLLTIPDAGTPADSFGVKI
ncbi:putative uncharacterized oxidoreductase [Escovopsis weberi]|uniref:Uncharacterized oxidoreductase n=1 Tax=Escovopsis weberi TaxID=150374 RepID=A0A0M9VSZ5_ESCWE|nr:putative uncharacterized oxidoreductase [Escovopsis weberi]